MLAVAAYAQNLGTLLLELRVVLPERGDLVGSPAGEIEYVKGQDYVLLPPVLAQADRIAGLGGKAEVRGPLPYLSRHKYPLVADFGLRHRRSHMRPIITYPNGRFHRRS